MKVTETKPDPSPLAPLIAHCAATRGGKSEVVRLMKEITGEDVHYRAVSRWLEPDRARRVEPLLSVGIVLLKVSHRLGLTPPLVFLEQKPQTKKETR